MKSNEESSSRKGEEAQNAEEEEEDRYAIFRQFQVEDMIGWSTVAPPPTDTDGSFNSTAMAPPDDAATASSPLPKGVLPEGVIEATSPPPPNETCSHNTMNGFEVDEEVREITNKDPAASGGEESNEAVKYADESDTPSAYLENDELASAEDVRRNSAAATAATPTDRNGSSEPPANESANSNHEGCIENEDKTNSIHGECLEKEEPSQKFCSDFDAAFGGNNNDSLATTSHPSVHIQGSVSENSSSFSFSNHDQSVTNPRSSSGDKAWTTFEDTSTYMSSDRAQSLRMKGYSTIGHGRRHSRDNRSAGTGGTGGRDSVTSVKRSSISSTASTNERGTPNPFNDNFVKSAATPTASEHRDSCGDSFANSFVGTPTPPVPVSAPAPIASIAETELFDLSSCPFKVHAKVVPPSDKRESCSTDVWGESLTKSDSVNIFTIKDDPFDDDFFQ